MAFPFPTFCPFEDGQEHLNLAHVARPEMGQRVYALPIGLRTRDTAEDVLQLEAAINEAEAHLMTLKTQMWLRSVLMQWETHFPTIEALRLNLSAANGEQEWRFELWHSGGSSETNCRGFTRRPPWDGDEKPPADRYRRELPQIEAATKLLRDLLVDLPKSDLTVLLLEEAFKLLPKDTGMTRQAWGALVFSTMPASVVPESRSVSLNEILPGESAAKPGHTIRF